MNCSVCARGGVAHQLPCILALVSSRFLVTPQKKVPFAEGFTVNMVKDDGFKRQRMLSVAEKIQLLTALLKKRYVAKFVSLGVEDSRQNKKETAHNKKAFYS